jgi:hypothetical protein
MNVIITDFLTGDCEFSGRSNTDCVRVALDESTPEAVISTAELIKWLRFKKRQEDKRENGRPTTARHAASA